VTASGPDPSGAARCRDVLVVIDGSPCSRAAVEEASLVAETCNARLTILGVRPRGTRWLSLFTGVPPVCVPRPSQIELDKESCELLRSATRRVPAGIPVTTIFSGRSLRAALRETLAKGDHDAVIYGTRKGHRAGDAARLRV
jgi:nucleotide-binding universal stress UspA family protein